MIFRLRVHAGAFARSCCPVAACLPLAPATPVRLVQQPGGRPRACQLVPDPQGSRLHWLVTRLPPQTIQEFHAIPAPGRKPPVPRFRWTHADDQAWVLHGDGIPRLKIVAEGTPGSLSLRLLHQQQPLTAATIEPGPGAASIGSGWWEARLCQPPSAGPVFAQALWTGTRFGTQERPSLTELWELRHYATPRSLTLLDLTITLQARCGPVHLDPASAFSVATASMHEPVAGTTGPQVFVCDAYGLSSTRSQAAWVRMRSGQCGLALFAHSDHPGGRGGWELGNPVRAMPLLHLEDRAAFAVPPRIVLATGESLSFRYRILLHEAEVGHSWLQARYADLVAPPSVELLDGA
jgi:hypothetical protein